jgi:hypothetical protein
MVRSASGTAGMEAGIIAPSTRAHKFGLISRMIIAGYFAPAVDDTVHGELEGPSAASLSIVHIIFHC